MATGEIMPPTPDGLLKVTRDESFSHYVHHQASNQKLSTPPESKNQTIWGQNVPEGLKDECAKIIHKSLGERAAGLKIEAYRLCWYVTPFPPSLTDLLRNL